MRWIFFTNLKYQSNSMIINSFINEYMGGIFFGGHPV